jgi:hypothetical protein
MASATFLPTLVFSAMASMICDFVNAIMFSSFSIPCQDRKTHMPQQYKKWPPEDNKNQTTNEVLKSGGKTNLCQPRFIGHKLQLTQTPEQKAWAATLLLASLPAQNDIGGDGEPYQVERHQNGQDLPD